MNRAWLPIVGVALVVVTAVSFVGWIRLRAPSQKAAVFVHALQNRDYSTAEKQMDAQYEPFPGKLASYPRLLCNAYVQSLTPRTLLPSLLHRERFVYVITTINHVEGGPDIRTHRFRVTPASIQRLPSPTDAKPLPTEIKPASRNASEIPADVADVPALDLTIGGDKSKRYFLIGNTNAASQPRPLLLVLPGGDGSAGVTPFVRRVYKNALDDRWLVAQLVAPVWDEVQARNLVWPREAKPHPKADFTTETFISDVITDVKSRTAVGPIYALAWSSGGPPTYAMTLRENSPFTGAFIAMSVFYPAELSSAKATGRRFYLLQSPDDKMTRFEHAQRAQELLSAAGARVHLQSYSGGHGWRGPIWQMIRDGIRWLETTSPD